MRIIDLDLDVGAFHDGTVKVRIMVRHDYDPIAFHRAELAAYDVSLWEYEIARRAHEEAMDLLQKWTRILCDIPRGIQWDPYRVYVFRSVNAAQYLKWKMHSIMHTEMQTAIRVMEFHRERALS